MLKVIASTVSQSLSENQQVVKLPATPRLLLIIQIVFTER